MPVFALTLLPSSCVPSATEGVELLPGFRSYTTAADAASTIRSQRYSLRIVEARSNAPGDPRPPFSITRWEVDDYKLSSFQGSLEIEFMNDRLMRLAYYPRQVDAFNHEAISRGWAKADGADVVRDAGRVRIRKGIDYSGRSYFVFEDIQLVEEFEGWIKRYSKGGASRLSRDTGARTTSFSWPVSRNPQESEFRFAKGDVDDPKEPRAGGVARAR